MQNNLCKSKQRPIKLNSNSSRATNIGFSLVGCAFYRFFFFIVKLNVKLICLLMRFCIKNTGLLLSLLLFLCFYLKCHLASAALMTLQCVVYLSPIYVHVIQVKGLSILTFVNWRWNDSFLVSVADGCNHQMTWYKRLKKTWFWTIHRHTTKQHQETPFHMDGVCHKER